MRTPPDSRPITALDRWARRYVPPWRECVCVPFLSKTQPTDWGDGFAIGKRSVQDVAISIQTKRRSPYIKAAVRR